MYASQPPLLCTLPPRPAPVRAPCACVTRRVWECRTGDGAAAACADSPPFGRASTPPSSRAPPPTTLVSACKHSRAISNSTRRGRVESGRFGIVVRSVSREVLVGVERPQCVEWLDSRRGFVQEGVGGWRHERLAGEPRIGRSTIYRRTGRRRSSEVESDRLESTPIEGEGAEKKRRP